MAAVRDSSVVKYVNICSGRDALSGTYDNFRVNIAHDVSLQKVRACQLLNCSFVPNISNVPEDGSTLVFDQILDATYDPADFTNRNALMRISVIDASNTEVAWTAEAFPSRVAPLSFRAVGVIFKGLINDALTQIGYFGALGEFTISSGNWPYLNWYGITHFLPSRPGWKIRISPLVLGVPDADALSLLFFRQFVSGNPADNPTFEIDDGGFVSFPLVQGEGFLNYNHTMVTYKVPAGAYTYDELFAQLNITTRSPLVGSTGQPTQAIIFTRAPFTQKLIMTLTNDKPVRDPPVPPQSEFNIFTVTDTVLARTLGFEPFDNKNPIYPFQPYWTTQSSGSVPSLNGPLRCFLHARPINQQGGIVLVDGIPRSISSWAAIDLTNTGVGAGVYQDFTGGGDSTYFIGYVDNQDLSVLDFSLRYSNGDAVEVLYPGLEISLKLFLE